MKKRRINQTKTHITPVEAPFEGMPTRRDTTVPKKRNNATQGITLIALIITIIIILILAGVVLNFAIGERGIFKTAKFAKEETLKSQALEEIRLKVIDVQTQKAGNATLQDVVDYFIQDKENKYIISLTQIDSENDKITDEIPNVSNATEIFVIYKNYQFKIDDKLIVTFIGDYNVDNDKKDQDKTPKNLEKAIELGTDIRIADFFSNLNNVKVIYNGNEISSTKDLPVGEFKLKYNSEENIIYVVTPVYEEYIIDLSEKGHNLYLKNDAHVEQDEEGIYYLNFDGIDDYGQIEELEESIDWANGFTIELEATWEAFNEWSRIFDFGNGISDNIAVANYLSSSALNISYYINGWYNYYSNIATISRNEKSKYKIEVQNIEGTYKINFYKNNELIDTLNSSAIPRNVKRTTNYIGKSNDPSQGYFKGRIYSLKITQSDGTDILNYNIDKLNIEDDTSANKTIYIVGPNYDGMIEDISGKQHKLTLKKEMKVEQDEEGIYYLNFDGIDDYGQIEELEESIDWANGFTIELEATWEAFNEWSRIFDFGNGISDNIAVANYLSSSALNISYYINGWYNYYSNIATISRNEKSKYKIEVQNIEGTYKINFYKNNELIDTLNSSAIPRNVKRTTNYIGKSNDPSQGYFKGRIYSLKITQSDGTDILWFDVNRWLEISK